jgi:hypothetical protein
VDGRFKPGHDVAAPDELCPALASTHMAAGEARA